MDVSLKPGSIHAERVTKIYRLGEPRSVFSWKAIPSLFRTVDRGRSLTALDDVSFRIEPGETVGILGPNGTGKSTLLRVLTGITAATIGTVALAGRAAGVLELGSGFYDELNAYDNTLLNAQLLGMSRREMRAKLDEIFEFAELRDFVYAPMRQYSFGMRLRLAFSIAMALEPEILFLDEVMGVGDLQFQRRSAQRIRELETRGVTLLVVSHQLSDLTRTCRRGLLLRHGKLVHDGPIQESIDAYLAASSDGAAAGAPAASVATDGQVTITTVDVLGESGREQIEFRTGDAVVFRVCYRTEQPLDRPVVAVAIYREDGECMGIASTETSGFHTGRVQGSGQVQFLWECPFTRGGYRISASIADSSGKQLLAQVHSAAGFEVMPRSGFDQGAVRIDGQWSMTRMDV